MVSPNYFGDVIKKTTGDTASGHIRQVVILLAKNALSIKEMCRSTSQVGNLIFPTFRILRQSQAPAIRLTHFLQELQKRDAQTSCQLPPRASASHWQGYE